MKKIRAFIILALIQLSLQVEHCYVEQKVCKKCAEGYFLVNEKCVTVDHCEYIDSNTNKCQSCQYGYRLNEDKTSCVEIGEDHCSTYTNLEDGTKQCQYCQGGYKLNSDKTCELVTDHCIEAYEYDGYMCQNCEKGYAINRNKHICVEFPKCKRVDDDNKCIECDEDKNEFLSADLEGKCIVSPCEKFEEDGTCNECKDYFYLKDGECVYISHIPFCRGVEDDNINVCEHWVSFTSNPETAEQDKKDYEEKCLTRKEDGTCSECETGYLYDETEKKCLLIGCEEYEESPRCEYCEHGYILINDKTECFKVYPKSDESTSSKDSGSSSSSKDSGSSSSSKGSGSSSNSKGSSTSSSSKDSGSSRSSKGSSSSSSSKDSGSSSQKNPSNQSGETSSSGNSGRSINSIQNLNLVILILVCFL